MLQSKKKIFKLKYIWWVYIIHVWHNLTTMQVLYLNDYDIKIATIFEVDFLKKYRNMFNIIMDKITNILFIILVEEN